MADTSSDSLPAVLDVAALLEQHSAEDVVVLEVGPVCGWTDYFVIATPRSETHLRSLVDWIESLLAERSLRPLNGLRDSPGSGWVLIDCGSFVIHLMDRDKRDFYELEKLWFAAAEIYSSSKSSKSSSSSSSKSSS